MKARKPLTNCFYNIKKHQDIECHKALFYYAILDTDIRIIDTIMAQRGEFLTLLWHCDTALRWPCLAVGETVSIT